MRDRWVTVFVVLCLLQLPLFVALGRAPISYDMSIKQAETALSKPERNPQDLVAIHKALQDSEAALKATGLEDSRLARLDLDRALLAWNQGKIDRADGHFRQALARFDATHGPDSFHACVVNLRYAEFLLLTHRYNEALPRFERGAKPVEDTLGPQNPFAVRMLFRHVTLLAYMGRRGEAAELARDSLSALLANAGRFDELYLTQTASILDLLSRPPRNGGPPALPAAPGGKGWRDALLQAFRDGKQRLAESPEDGGGG